MARTEASTKLRCCSHTNALGALAEDSMMRQESEFGVEESGKFDAQISSNTSTSGASTALSLEELSSPDFYSRCCTEIDEMASRAVNETSIHEAIKTVIAGSQFWVTVADPRQNDLPLIAVSDKFETITGFLRHEVLGKNCRTLNDGCPVDPAVLLRLRSACETGAPFAAVLRNRRKSGELFLNLLDIRGLTVAQNPRTKEELWFLVGIQADITHLADDACEDVEKEAESLLSGMHDVANGIRMKLADELSALAVAGALMSNFEIAQEPVSPGPTGEEPDAWCLLSSPTWRRAADALWPDSALAFPWNTWSRTSSFAHLPRQVSAVSERRQKRSRSSSPKNSSEAPLIKLPEARGSERRQHVSRILSVAIIATAAFTLALVCQLSSKRLPRI